MWTEWNPGSFSSAGALNLAWGFPIQPSSTDKCRRGKRGKKVHTAVEREWKEKIGEAVPSACLSLLLLQCLWFIRGMMAGQAKGQLWRFGRRSKQGKAGDWFVIVILCGLLCQQAAHLTAVIEKAIPSIYKPVTCHSSAPMSLEFSFIEREKRKQQLSCQVWKGEERRVGEVPPQATWGHWWHKESLYISLLHLVRDVDLVATHCLSIFPFTTGLDYITMHSLTHLLPCAHFPADG